MAGVFDMGTSTNCACKPYSVHSTQGYDVLGLVEHCGPAREVTLVHHKLQDTGTLDFGLLFPFQGHWGLAQAVRRPACSR